MTYAITAAQQRRAHHVRRDRRAHDAIDVAGADQVAMALESSEPFGRLCRQQAERTRSGAERHAWQELAGTPPREVRDRMAARGIVLFGPRSDRRGA